MCESALWLYRTITSTARGKRLSSLRSQGSVPIAILFYHRVANSTLNDWTLSCSDFRRQLDWVQANYDVVSLEEAQRRIRSSFCDRPTVALTFDDGYADNAETAIPELLQRGLTCTYFVSTNFVRAGEPFPHDVRAGAPLRPNSIDQLRQFAASGIEIGAHTRSHPNVGSLSPAQLAEEIGGSFDDLEGWLERPVRYFAFPFGLPKNTSQAAVDYLTHRGVAGFCTAYGALNWPRQHGIHLKRIHADPGLERLKNWLTLDRRKLRDRHVLPFAEPETTGGHLPERQRIESNREATHTGRIENGSATNVSMQFYTAGR